MLTVAGAVTRMSRMSLDVLWMSGHASMIEVLEVLEVLEVQEVTVTETVLSGLLGLPGLPLRKSRKSMDFLSGLPGLPWTSWTSMDFHWTSTVRAGLGGLLLGLPQWTAVTEIMHFTPALIINKIEKN